MCIRDRYKNHIKYFGVPTMSDAHIPSSVRAQAASEGSPTRFPTHTYRTPIERRRQSGASPTPCPTHKYQAPFVVSMCFYTYAVPAYLLETPLGLYNGNGSHFEFFRQNRIPGDDANIFRSCMPSLFVKNRIRNVQFELKSELLTIYQRCSCRYPLPRLPHCRRRTAQRHVWR